VGGRKVIGAARKPDSAADLRGLDVEVLQFDVADALSVARFAKNLYGRAIDLLINYAGIFPRVGNLFDVDFDEVDRPYAVTSIGPMRVAQVGRVTLRSMGRREEPQGRQTRRPVFVWFLSAGIGSCLRRSV
jgi:NAD(P)-dependent dehydrogenase (short-subunit alcohol dehydrogenase family)